jgi:hypothetical protein
VVPTAPWNNLLSQTGCDLSLSRLPAFEPGYGV